MSILNRLGIKFVYRKCPHGFIHNVNKNEGNCGHGGIILNWVEEYRRWIPNPTMTEYAKDMIEEDEEFAVEKEARLQLEEEVKKGNLKPIEDFRKRIMRK